MSERGRVVGIFAVVALVAGGAGFYYFKIYQPAQALKANPTIPFTRWTPIPGMLTVCPATPMMTPIISDIGQITIPIRIASIRAATTRTQNPP